MEQEKVMCIYIEHLTLNNLIIDKLQKIKNGKQIICQKTKRKY